MNGIDYIADTNALIYLLAGDDCMIPYLKSKIGVSIISVMEILSFPEITENEEKTIRGLLEQCEILQIDDETKEKAIQIRKTFKIKLPDAIIAATAIVQSLPLITADAGLNKVKDLQLEKIIP